MAAPNYSPAGGFGTTYTDSATGVTYMFQKPGSWIPISSGKKQPAQTVAPSSGGGSVNPNDAGSIKSAYPGYEGWNDEAAIKADFAATGGAGKGGGGGGGDDGGGGGGQDTDSLIEMIAKLIGSPTELPPLQVKSFEEYEAIALDELRPYYERILAEEGGDIEKAKSRLEVDYQTGIRYKKEDAQDTLGKYGTQMNQGERVSDYYNRVKNEFGMFPEEGIKALSNVNQRGILHSGIADVEGRKLQQDQERRREAVQKAVSRYEEQATLTKDRKLEDWKTAWDRRQFELGEQKKEEAGTLGRQKRADEVATQEIERENIMRKAVQNWYG